MAFGVTPLPRASSPAKGFTNGNDSGGACYAATSFFY
jgi:hypothetical protein